MVRRDTPDILAEILESKRREVQRLKVEVPQAELQRLAEGQEPALSLRRALTGDSVRIIAEVKKASPARGLLRREFDPGQLATMYVDNGAAAISVLTDEGYFQGSLEHLKAAKVAASPAGVPILRKEFIFDPYQVFEARGAGADAILLIVAMLTPECLAELLELSAKLGMECLVEAHDRQELESALDAGAEVLGINNRDLRTFDTDLAVTEALAPSVPEGKTIVSESGISRRSHIDRIAKAGAHAALVGEALVTADDPGAKLRELA